MKRAQRDWMVSVPRFPAERRDVIKRIADKNRMKVGPFIGKFLDDQIAEYERTMKKQEGSDEA